MNAGTAPTTHVTITVEAAHGGGTVTVEADVVAPGLAVAPAVGVGRDVVPDRYAIVHIASGKALTRRWLCREHAYRAAEVARMSAVDWTSVVLPWDEELAAVCRSVAAMWRPACCPGPAPRGGAR